MSVSKSSVRIAEAWLIMPRCHVSAALISRGVSDQNSRDDSPNFPKPNAMSVFHGMLDLVSRSSPISIGGSKGGFEQPRYDVGISGQTTFCVQRFDLIAGEVVSATA